MVIALPVTLAGWLMEGRPVPAAAAATHQLPFVAPRLADDKDGDVWGGGRRAEGLVKEAHETLANAMSLLPACTSGWGSRRSPPGEPCLRMSNGRKRPSGPGDIV